MSLTYAIANALSFAFGKFLLKKYLNDDGVSTVADVLTDIAKPKIKEILDRKKAARAVEELADKIVAQVQELLEEERRQQPDLNVEGIAEQLLATLQIDLSAEFFVKGDLVPQRVADNYAALRPLPRGALDPRSGEAYGRMLDLAARCLVGLANQLPDFQEQAITASLQRLRSLEDIADKTFAQMRQMVTAVERLAAPGDPQKFEMEYRQAVAANLDYIELFGITISRELRRFQLTDAFVSLNLQRSLTPTKNPARNKKRKPESPDADEEQPESELLSCEAVLERLRPGEGRLLIRGAAGSGKTTLMRWIAIQAANMVLSTIQQFRLDEFKTETQVQLLREYKRLREAKDTSGSKFLETVISNPSIFYSAELGYPGFWSQKVPFVVMLRHCPSGKLPLAEDFPKLIGQGIGCPPIDWVRTALKDGRGLVLIDGVDEVPPDQREEVVRGLEQLTKQYPDSYFVVTTRPEAAPDGWLAHLNFREAHINPMGPSDVEQFIRRWHDIAGRNLTVAGKPGDLSDKRQRLLDQIDENDALRPLSTYPLLCGSICALHLDRSGTLPETQSALCEAMCDSLLHHREREQQEFDLTPFPAAYRELSVDQKRTLIQDLAVYMVEEGRSVLPHSQARDRLAKRLAGFKNRSADEADIVLKGLLERSGILREPLPDQVDFLHNTFKEYLAGEHFAAERSTNKLLEHVFTANDGAESWRRITLFAAGSRRAPEVFICELVERLLEVPSDESPSEKKFRRSKKQVLSDPQRLRHLLALQCQIVADGRGLSPELKTQLASLVKELFPPRTLSDAESLATLRDQAVPFLVRREDGSQTVKDATNCVRALRLINTKSARRALESYYHLRWVSVLNELALVESPLNLPGIIDALTGFILVTETNGFIFRHRVGEQHELLSKVPETIRERVDDISLIKNYAEIQYLDLYATQVRDFALLPSFVELRTLILNSTIISDLTVLETLKKLTWLDLGGTSISDISVLKSLPSLTTLSLCHTNVGDISPLRGLRNIETLYVDATLVTDFSPLSDLITLKYLDLSSSQFSDVNILSTLHSLSCLDIHDSRVDDVSGLEGLTALWYLDLRNTKVTDIAPLKRLTALTELHLHGTLVSDSDVSALQEAIPDLKIFR